MDSQTILLIDTQHDYLINYLDRISSDTDAYNILGVLLSKWPAHCLTEYQFMRGIGYPKEAMSEHAEDHSAISDLLLDLASSVFDDSFRHKVQVLRQRILAHVHLHDSGYVAFYKQRLSLEATA